MYGNSATVVLGDLDEGHFGYVAMRTTTRAAAAMVDLTVGRMLDMDPERRDRADGVHARLAWL
jgi:hypothetical protein